MIGGAGSSVAVGDIDASTAAQSGQLYAVTVDDSGTLGKGSALASAQAVASLGNNFRQVASFHDAEITALNGRVDALDFQLEDLDSDIRRGVAAAMAQADAPIPSAPGKTSYMGKGSTFRGEFAFSLGLAHRLDTDSPFALTASLSHAGGKNTGATVGFTGEF